MADLGAFELFAANTRERIRRLRADGLLERHLAPVKDSDADVVGLGCTHYPFLRSRIKSMLGPGVTLYDPSRPVARRVRQLLEANDAFAANPNPAFRFYTTGNAEIVRRVASKLLRTPVAHVEHIEL